jgi:hypothetical protein
MAAFEFHRQRTRRWWYAGLTLAVAALFAVFFVAGAGAVLTNSPSSFEANDGNMTVETASNSDWNCFAGHDGFHSPASDITVGLACSSSLVFSGAFTKSDLAATTADDSWVNGQKMDLACAKLATNKNPAKDDFTNVATYTETASNKHTFLYGATIRVAPNGNSSENVELNQVAGTAACPITRTAGDRLLAFDYLNGGTTLNLHVLTWITPDDPSTPLVDESKLGGNLSSTCIVKNDNLPCWGSNILTPSPATFEGQVNQAPIAQGANAISYTALDTGEFAEFGVDLTTALGQSTDTCNTFAQTVWESRSSGSSFSSNPEDIAIESKTISNCGSVIIRKVTSPSPDPNDTSFGFSDTIVSATDTFSLKNGGSKDFGSSIQAGSYSVSETPNSLYTLSNIDCSASSTTNGSTTTIGASGGFDAGDTSISISLKAGDSIDCTYTNTLKTGALLIKKNSTKSGVAVLKAGATFCYSTSTGCTTVTGTNVTDTTDSTGGDSDTAIGEVCVSGVSTGTYYVNETGAPTGYGLVTTGQTNKTVTVVSGTNCSSNLPTGSAIVTFTDPPLADVQIDFRDGGSGETSLDSAMTCTASNSTGTDASATAPTGWTTSDRITGVQAGSAVVTVTCTANIDP